MVRKSVLSGKTWQDWSQKDVISSSKINFPDFNFKNMETMMVRHVEGTVDNFQGLLIPQLS